MTAYATAAAGSDGENGLDHRNEVSGIAEAVTRHVTNLGFDLGAANVQLQASSMGEPIYRRMGYEDLHRREFRLAPPPS